MKKLLFILFLLLSVSVLAQAPTPTPSEQTPEPQKTAPLPEPRKSAPTPGPQETVPLPDKPNPQLPSTISGPQPDYSMEAYVVKDFEYLARFENDGTGTRTFNAVIQVNSDAGVQQWGQLVFGYSSANEKLDINYVRVRKNDGRVVTATPDAVQDLTAGVARFAPMYTDYREKHITVPALRPGDTLEYSIVTRTETPLAPNQFWLNYDFDRNIIVLNEVLEVNVPKDKAIKLKTDPGYDPVVTTEGDRKIYRWKTRNLRRKTEEELKKEWKKKRRRMDDDDQPSVQLTTFQSWEEVGKWYAPLQKDRIKATPELKAKALELTKDKKTELEKIKALYDFVAPEFRYVSLSFGVGRYQPHSAGDIFANKYGDCKDKHTLLSTMLSVIGVHADPVLINSQRQLDPDIPSPGQFDHVITLVTLSNKQKIWLDTTTEVAPFQLLSYQIRHKKALWVPLDGKAQVIETPADAPVPNEQILDLDGKINDVGTLTAKLHFTFRGDSELLFRTAFRNAPENEWKNIAGNLGLKGEATDIKVSDPADTNKPFEVSYSLSMPNYMAWSSKTPAFGVPLPQASIPEIDEDSDDQPDEVTLTGAPISCDFKVRLEVPEKYSIGLPLPASIRRDYGTYSVTYAKDKNIITAERKFTLNIRELPKDRIGDFAAFHRIINSDQAQQIALETKSNSGPTLPAGMKVDDLIAAGAAAMQNQNYAAAIESYKRATELEPKNKTAWRGLGASYLQMQKKDQAIAAFNKLLEINPYDEYAYLGIGFSHIIDHDYDKAVEAFRKQVEINPLDSNAQFSLASSLVQLRRWDEALPELQKCAQLMPRSPDIQSALGQVYLELKQNDKAMEAFNKAVDLGANATIWNNVAYELANHNLQLDRAQQYAESAVTEIATQLRNVDVERLRMDDYRRVNAISSYWDTLGWVHFRRGDVGQAKKFIESAWMLGPNGEVAYHLGEIYEKEGHRDQAIQMYAAAAGVKRSYQPAKTKLEEILKDKKKADEEAKKAGAKYDTDPKLELGAASKDDGSADFAFVFAPGPKVEGVKFLSGDDKLKSLNDKLASLKFPVEFPDTTPTKLVRRGTVTCKSDACTLTLQASDEVTSAE
jgi:tetratricopeptide (TPR) repeat protein/transglutaminase-like putative cysteine protease